MTHKVKNQLLSTVLFIVLSGLGLTLGLSFAKGISYLGQEGFLTSWKLFNGPSKFTRIVNVTLIEIWAQASNGKLYTHYDCVTFFGWSLPECRVWTESQSELEDIYSGQDGIIERGVPCPNSRFKYFKNPPENPIDCVFYFDPGADTRPNQYLYYALLDDGTIWNWRYSGSGLLNILLYPLGFCSGVALGITTFYFVNSRRKKL